MSAHEIYARNRDRRTRALINGTSGVAALEEWEALFRRVRAEERDGRQTFADQASLLCAKCSEEIGDLHGDESDRVVGRMKKATERLDRALVVARMEAFERIKDDASCEERELLMFVSSGLHDRADGDDARAVGSVSEWERLLRRVRLEEEKSLERLSLNASTRIAVYKRELANVDGEELTRMFEGLRKAVLARDQARREARVEAFNRVTNDASCDVRDLLKYVSDEVEELVESG